MIRRLAAEGLGTALLVVAVVGSGLMAERLSGGNAGLALLANAIATGAALYVLITVLGPISASFNPVVTLALGDRPRGERGLHIAAQVAGGVLGVWLTHAQFGLPLWQVATTPRDATGQWLAEGVATFGLVLAIAGCLRHTPDRLAATVALYITGAYWFTASTSFANPAVTIARTLTDSFAGIAPAAAPGFIAAQALGGLAGWTMARWLFSRPAP
jgi:glycerol uptake facilitator-like aquaporin